MFVVVDTGNFSTKYFFEMDSRVQMGCFSSVSHEYVGISQEAYFRPVADMHRVEFDGLDQWIGEGAKNLYAYKKNEEMYTGHVSKGHFDALLRVILALHHVKKTTGTNSFDLVVLSPFVSIHSDKRFFEDLLLNEHTACVDSEDFTFCINSLRIATEGLGAKYFVLEPNCIILDVGSQTTNILSFSNGLLLSTDPSTTVNIGTQSQALRNIGSKILRKLNMVDRDFPVRVSGGKSDEIAKILSQIGFIDCRAITAECEPWHVNGLGTYKLLKNGVNAR